MKRAMLLTAILTTFGCVMESDDNDSDATIEEVEGTDGATVECVTPASECVAYSEARYCSDTSWGDPVDCAEMCRANGSGGGCCGVLPDGNGGCLCCSTADCVSRIAECGPTPTS